MPTLGQVVMGRAGNSAVWSFIDTFTDGNFTSNPTWDAVAGDSSGWSVSGNKLVAASPSRQLSTNNSPTFNLSNNGTWAVRMNRSSGYAQFAFWGGSPGGFFINPPQRNGRYYIRTDGSTVSLWRGDGASCEVCSPTETQLASTSYAPAADNIWRMDRNQLTGLMHVYHNGMLKLTHTDTPGALSQFQYITVHASGSADFDDIYFNPNHLAGASPIDPVVGTGGWTLLDDFNDGNYTSSPTWTVHNGSPSVSGNQLLLPGGSGGVKMTTPLVSNTSTGSWAVSITQNRDGAGAQSNRWFFVADSGPSFNNSYFIQWQSSGAATIRRRIGGSETTIASFTGWPTEPVGVDTSVWRVHRDMTGLIEVYNDGVLVGSATDTNITTSSVWGFDFTNAIGTNVVDNCYYATSPTAGASPIG